jgi:hypothetical protein
MKTETQFNAFRIPLLMVVAALTIVTSAQAEPPVKVYVMAGQSNMQGKGAIKGDHGGSLEGIVKNHPKAYAYLVDGDGEWIERKDVWAYLDQKPNDPKFSGMTPGFGSSGGQIGPELGFGFKIGDLHDEQVLVIKACWGGKSVGHNFLPPSIGKYAKPKMPSDPGFYYHEILRIVKEVTENIGTLFPDYQGQGVEIAGFCWHQGWNDQYGGLDATYETNLAAFIRDIRSVEHGLGVPDLPFVIATSGMINPDSPVVQGQIAIGDASKHPEFDGNVAVIDTHKPYGPDKMTFKFNNDGVTDKVGYHWNNNARSYLHIGLAMAGEMPKLKRPATPSRFRAHGCGEGVQLLWQLGTEKPRNVEVLRNGKRLGARIPVTQSAFVDTSAAPGANRYELILDMPSGKVTLVASCDTSATGLSACRSLAGVMLTWQAHGKYEGFRIKRDGKVIADALAADARSFEDRDAPAKGKVTYSVEPTTGKVTPAALVVNRGPADPGGAVLYEPFDYPADADQVEFLVGKGGALGTKGSYVYLGDRNPERAPATVAGGLSFGDLPVTGNRGSTHRWSEGGYIELDDSLKKAGLLADGATMWMSYVFRINSNPEHTHRNGGGIITLRSADMQVGVGFKSNGRQYETAVVQGGQVSGVRITGVRPNTSTLVVARITWGKDGENDSIVPFPGIGPDLKLPEKEGRHFKPPVNVDQSKFSRLVLSGEGQFDEIRVGPTFESVVGQGK